MAFIGCPLFRDISMKLRRAFAEGLRQARNARGLTQEDFGEVSSRTYVSMLERGERTPTLEKIDRLSTVLKVHPLTLLTLVYMKVHGDKDGRALQARVLEELLQLTA